VTKSAEGPLRELFLESGAKLDWSGFHNAYTTNQPVEPVQRHLIDDLAYTDLACAQRL
jgi:hypothetical protein